MLNNFTIGLVYGSKYVVVTSLAQILFPIVKEIKYPHKFFSVKHKTMPNIFVIGSVLGKSSRPASVRSCPCWGEINRNASVKTLNTKSCGKNSLWRSEEDRGGRNWIGIGQRKRTFPETESPNLILKCHSFNRRRLDNFNRVFNKLTCFGIVEWKKVYKLGRCELTAFSSCKIYKLSYFDKKWTFSFANRQCAQKYWSIVT